MIQALYIDARGPYPALLGAANCWDASRDARGYAGPDPVIAHPPCGPWSSRGAVSANYEGSEHDCAPRAIDQVRRFGGVLEHPAHSLLWKRLGLPKPGAPSDRWRGFTVEVTQVEWGHVARKPTWLYVVGVSPKTVERLIAERPFPGREPTHWLSGFREHSRRKQTGAAVPPGIKVCSAQQRRRTPIAFAEFLIALTLAAESYARLDQPGGRCGSSPPQGANSTDKESA